MRIQCKIQVGETVREFWVVDDLLDPDNASVINDARQNEAMRRVKMSFVGAYSAEVAARRAQS